MCLRGRAGRGGASSRRSRRPGGSPRRARRLRRAAASPRACRGYRSPRRARCAASRLRLASSSRSSRIWSRSRPGCPAFVVSRAHRLPQRLRRELRLVDRLLRHRRRPPAAARPREHPEHSRERRPARRRRSAATPTSDSAVAIPAAADANRKPSPKSARTTPPTASPMPTENVASFCFSSSAASRASRRARLDARSATCLAASPRPTCVAVSRVGAHRPSSR